MARAKRDGKSWLDMPVELALNQSWHWLLPYLRRLLAMALPLPGVKGGGVQLKARLVWFDTVLTAKPQGLALAGFYLQAKGGIMPHPATLKVHSLKEMAVCWVKQVSCQTSLPKAFNGLLAPLALNRLGGGIIADGFKPLVKSGFTPVCCGLRQKARPIEPFVPPKIQTGLQTVKTSRPTIKAGSVQQRLGLPVSRKPLALHRLNASLKQRFCEALAQQANQPVEAIVLIAVYDRLWVTAYSRMEPVTAGVKPAAGLRCWFKALPYTGAEGDWAYWALGQVRGQTASASHLVQVVIPLAQLCQ